MKVTDLSNYKDRKKMQVLVKDLEVILTLFDMSLTGLKQFNKYSSVKECSNLMTLNRILLKKYLDKYKELINGKLEESV